MAHIASSNCERPDTLINNFNAFIVSSFSSIARCCYPIPGDKVAGILTSSKGLVLHRFDCGNLLRAKQKDEQWLEVDWQADDDEEFEVLICIQNENRRGMLASIANAIAKVNINIENLEIEENDDTMKALKLLISVSGLSQLDEAMCAIKSLEFVYSVSRVSNKKS
jgi:GTP pyrophosphokinase